MGISKYNILKTVDIYIIRKFLSTFILAISLIIIIVIIFDISENIDEFIEKKAPISEILFDYYLNFIPYFVNLFSALFTFIAVIFFTAKLSAQTEIVSILCNGVSFRRLLVPYLFSAVLIAILTFYLANFLIPITNANRLEFVKTYIKNRYHNSNRNIHMQIGSGTYAYVERYNVVNNIGYDFTLEKYSNGVLYYKLSASSISWDSIGEYWIFRNYYKRYMNGLNETLLHGVEMDTIINLSPKDFDKKTDDIELMNYWELRDFIETERLKGADVKYYEVEKHKRMAFPFACIVLTVIGVSVSSRKVRGGIGIHIAFGLAVAFAYILFLRVTETFAIYSNWSPMLAVWLPNIIFLIIGIVLVRLAPK